MPLIRCHSCGQSFERDLKKTDRCPLCDGWAGNEIAVDRGPQKQSVQKPQTQPQPSSHGNGGWNIRGVLLILAPIIIFLVSLSQGKGCDAAWDDAKSAFVAILTHNPGDNPPPAHDKALSRLRLIDPAQLPDLSQKPQIPERDTIFGLGDHVRASVDIAIDNGGHIAANSAGMIASIGDEVSGQQRYWVTWVHPDLPAVICVDESCLLPDEATTAVDCASAASWISSQFQRPGAKYNPRRAFVWCRRAAQLGDPASMCALGWMYSQGSGVAKDETAAVPWYRRSAELGNATAMANLGMALRDGSGITQDDTEAVNWFRKGADAGDSLATDNVGWMLLNARGVGRDEAEAVKWFRKAADLQCGWGMLHLGTCYLNGTGIGQDRHEAIQWLNKAVTSGNAPAMSSLGDCYENGWGVTQDDAQAVIWYQKAAALGERGAQELLKKRGIEWKAPPAP